jgi:hypothetical protein
MCPATPNGDLTIYDKCLGPHESVEKATQVGPFTTLAIRYSRGSGYYGTSLAYQQLLYKGRMLATNVAQVRRWDGLSSAVLFADWTERYGLNSYLIYERAGQAIVEQLDKSEISRDADYEFPYGYPLRHGVRYFPRSLGEHDAGFLLQVLPTRVTQLPPGPGGVNVPLARSLAGIAPDGRAYAYINSVTAPSAVVVVGADGSSHDPIPIPLTSVIASARPDANPFEPAWRWFAATFSWEQDARGRWTIVPSWARAAIAPANPVEEPFIDAIAGYKSCFASAHPACIQGWRFVQDSADRFGDCCLSRLAYEPIKPTQAFDADVTAIVYSKSITWDSGYRLLLNAPHDHVIATLTKRLQSRKVPFVRTDQCPDLASESAPCVARLKLTIHWKDPIDPSALWAIFSTSEHAAVFMTPTAAIAVYAAPNGRTWVDTLARYDLSDLGRNQ